MKLKNVIFLLLVLVSTSCTTPKKLFVENLREKNQLWGLKDNNYFYFMIDSVGDKHLVKTSMFNSSKVIWIEKMRRK